MKPSSKLIAGIILAAIYLGALAAANAVGAGPTTMPGNHSADWYSGFQAAGGAVLPPPPVIPPPTTAPVVAPPVIPPVVLIPSGVDWAVATKNAKANTIYRNTPAGAPVVWKSSSLFIAGQDYLTFDFNNGPLTIGVSAGSSTAIGVVGAQHVTIENATSVTGPPTAALLLVESPYCVIDNIKGVKGLLKFVQFQNSGNNFLVNNCETLQTVSYSIFIMGVHDGTVLGCNIGPSQNESPLRCVGYTPNSGPVVPYEYITIKSCHLSNPGPAGTKPPAQFRAKGNFMTFVYNVVDGTNGDGWIRFGDTGATDLTSGVNNLLVQGNVFSNAQNAVQMFSGCSGVITGNTFTPTADTASPVVAGPNCGITVTDNIQQFTQGQAVKPLVAPTSSSKVHDGGNNRVVVVPAK